MTKSLRLQWNKRPPNMIFFFGTPLEDDICSDSHVQKSTANIFSHEQQIKAPLEDPFDGWWISFLMDHGIMMRPTKKVESYPQSFPSPKLTSRRWKIGGWETILSVWEGLIFRVHVSFLGVDVGSSIFGSSTQHIPQRVIYRGRMGQKPPKRSPAAVHRYTNNSKSHYLQGFCASHMVQDSWTLCVYCQKQHGAYIVNK